MRRRRTKFHLDAKNTILNDQFLTMVYKDIYKEFFLNSGGRTSSNVLELGAGGVTFAQNYWKKVTISDIDDSLAQNDLEIIDAGKLPFADETFDVVIAKDSLHHFKDPLKALEEISRVLKPGGSFQISEPYWSLLGRFVFRFLHPEKWDPKVSTLKLESENPWESNQALLLLLTADFSKELKFKLPNLRLNLYGSTYSLSYLFSGGVFSRTFLSSKFLLVIYNIEKKVMPITQKVLGLNILAEFKKS